MPKKETLLREIAELREKLAKKEQELALYKGAEHDPYENIAFTDLFDLDAIQKLQDSFARATGVGSLITEPDGTPITRPSNFCSFCALIRATEAGRRNCRKSDTAIGRHNPSGPTIRPCLSAGLWDAGASITVNGRHIASWLAGQIRVETAHKPSVLAYAREIGADEQAIASAYDQVTVMPLEQFRNVCEFLFLLANILSLRAFQYLLLRNSVAEISTAHADAKRLRNFLNNIIDSMPSILVGVDAQGLVTHWNMGAVSATGFDKNQARGRLLADVLPTLAGNMGQVIKAIHERKPVECDMLQEVVDGSLRYTDISVYPLIANGIEGAVIRVDDVTERIRIEELIIQSEKMLSIGGLAAGIAHEVNNPLAAIQGNARLLAKRLLEDSPKNQTVAASSGTNFQAVKNYVLQRGIETMIKGISESSLQAGRVVSNMLGFSRKSDGSYGRHDILEILERAVNLLKNGQDSEQEYHFKDILFTREYAENLPEVYCEPTNLQQAFFNILKNGAQAMIGHFPSSGRAPHFVLRCSQNGAYIHVEISDNGPGMSPKILRRIFEPFFTTKGIGVGTGLGMSIAYFIIAKSLGGSLSATSVQDQGATFHADIPVHPPERPYAPATDSA